MNKIEALQKTIYNLENDVYEYDWSKADTCNCGVLARTILSGKTATECGFLDSERRNHKLTCFANYAYCMTTNIPLPEVFAALKGTGFSHQELLELENLSNDKILGKLGLTSRRFNEDPYFVVENCLRGNKPTLIKYLKAWVEILQEQEPKPSYPDITKQLAVLPIEETTDKAQSHCPVDTVGL